MRVKFQIVWTINQERLPKSALYTLKSIKLKQRKWTTKQEILPKSALYTLKNSNFCSREKFNREF